MKIPKHLINVPKDITQTPSPQIIIRAIHCLVFPDCVRCIVVFLPDTTMREEARAKDFPLDTPFITILEKVSDVFIDWSPVRIPVLS